MPTLSELLRECLHKVALQKTNSIGDNGWFVADYEINKVVAWLHERGVVMVEDVNACIINAAFVDDHYHEEYQQGSIDTIEQALDNIRRTRNEAHNDQ